MHNEGKIQNRSYLNNQEQKNYEDKKSDSEHCASFEKNIILDYIPWVIIWGLSQLRICRPPLTLDQPFMNDEEFVI